MYVYMCVYIYIYIHISLSIYIYIHFCRVCKPRISESEFLGDSLWIWGFHPLLPVEVRCYIFV